MLRTWPVSIFRRLRSIPLTDYSFGGLVALEMAQRLSETGKKVALLVLPDTYPHPRYLTGTQHLRLADRRLGSTDWRVAAWVRHSNRLRIPSKVRDSRC